MKLLLGSLLLAGVCWLGAALDLPTMENFQNLQIVGHWYPVANIFIEDQFPKYTLNATKKGGLLYSYKYLQDGQCKERSSNFKVHGSPGKFKINSIGILQVVDTDYTSYIISYVRWGSFSFLTLAAKEKSLATDLMIKFTNFASSAGIAGQILPMDALEEC